MKGGDFNADFEVGVEVLVAFIGMGAHKPAEKSELFNPPGRVAVPGLAARALPEMLQRFKATGGAAVAAQWFGGLLKGALHLGLLCRVELFASQPLGRSNQRGVFQQMLGV